MENPPFSTENRSNFIYRKTFFSNLLFQSSVVQLENKPIGSQLLMRTGKVLDVSCLEHEGFTKAYDLPQKEVITIPPALKKTTAKWHVTFCGQLADPKLVYNTVS